jgi:hypothetical protein
MMPIPVGTWTIFTFGPAASQQGALTILPLGSNPGGTLTIGGVSQSLSVLWDETAQQLTFTTIAIPAGGALAPFDVYQGNAFQPFPTTLPPIVLAGIFRHYTPGAGAAPISEFGWFAIGPPKPKEKEKEKEKEHKDKEKDHKDKEKDGAKEIEKHPLDKVAEFQFTSGDSGGLQNLEQRVAALEHRTASGQSFIKPDERPAVGEPKDKKN